MFLNLCCISSDYDQFSVLFIAQLYSCLEALRNILGDSTPEHILVDAVIKVGFDHEKALNAILTQQGKSIH
jgi:elongation factor 1 alpha-like protein